MSSFRTIYILVGEDNDWFTPNESGPLHAYRNRDQAIEAQDRLKAPKIRKITVDLEGKAVEDEIIR